MRSTIFFSRRAVSYFCQSFSPCRQTAQRTRHRETNNYMGPCCAMCVKVIGNANGISRLWPRTECSLLSNLLQVAIFTLTLIEKLHALSFYNPDEKKTFQNINVLNETNSIQMMLIEKYAVLSMFDPSWRIEPRLTLTHKDLLRHMFKYINTNYETRFDHIIV